MRVHCCNVNGRAGFRRTLNRRFALVGAEARVMRSVSEYLARAAEFDELVRSSSEPALITRYADIAECYRLLACERQRLIETDTIEPEPA
jgi:hypothetical protein